MWQVPVDEAGGQFAEKVAERGHDAVTLPARSEVDHRLERVQHGRPDLIGTDPSQRRFYPHQSLEDAVSLPPGTTVTPVHLVEDAGLALDGGQSPEKVRGRVDVVSVRTSNDVGDVAGTAADGAGRY